MNTLTNADSVLVQREFQTNRSGAIVSWGVVAQRRSGEFFNSISSYLTDDFAVQRLCGNGANTSICTDDGTRWYVQTGEALGNPGTWVLQTDPDIIPSPAGAWLMLSGLAALGGFSLRRKKAAA